MKIFKILISIIITFLIILISYKLSEKIKEIEILHQEKYCLEEIEKSYIYSQNKSCEKISIEALCKNTSKKYVLNYVYIAKDGCESSYLIERGWKISEEIV